MALGGGGATNPSPVPTPYRATYGFVLWLFSYLFLFLYIVWAVIPDDCFYSARLNFFSPQKYWAIAVPAYIVTICLFFLFILYPSINLVFTPSLNNIIVFQDEYSSYTPGNGIAPISDIPLTVVSEMLYGGK